MISPIPILHRSNIATLMAIRVNDKVGMHLDIRKIEKLRPLKNGTKHATAGIGKARAETAVMC